MRFMMSFQYQLKSCRHLKWTLPREGGELPFCNPSFSCLHLPSVPGKVHDTVHSRIPLTGQDGWNFANSGVPCPAQSPKFTPCSSTPSLPMLSLSVQHIPTASCNKKTSPGKLQHGHLILSASLKWKKTHKRVIMSWGHHGTTCDLQKTEDRVFCGEDEAVLQRWPAIKRVAASPSALLGTLLISNKVITRVDRGKLGQNSGLARNYHGKKNKADVRLYEPLCEPWEWRGPCTQGSGKGRVTSFSGKSGLCEFQTTVKLWPCLAP